MADASKILLTGDEKPVYQFAPLKKELAELTTQLLRANHESWHVYFNDRGFHNHIPHQLLTLYSLSAAPSFLTAAYEANVTYQRPAKPTHSPLLKTLQAHSSSSSSTPPSSLLQHLGDEAYYPDFVAYYSAQVAAHGWPAVVRDALFRGTPEAEDLLARLFGGVVHPLLHLGFGVEFAQEGVVVEGLAQAAVHENWIARIFRECEEASGNKTIRKGERKGFLELVRAVGADEEVKSAARGVGQFSDGREVWGMVGERLASVAGEFVVYPEEADVEARTKEVVNGAVLLATTALQVQHIPKLDFFYMHLITSTISLVSLLHSPSLALPTATRAKLLTYYAYTALFVYATRGAQPLSPQRLYTYAPKHAEHGVKELVRRAVELQPTDDGHVVKTVRGVLAAWQLCGGGGQGEDGVQETETFEQGIADDATWLRALHLVVDAVEAPGPKWVRAAGFVELWKEVPLVEDEGKSGVRGN
ncbi:uncharacterized protein BKA78DRAFT_256101 [Phyllosticta capitalensis]|uniref:uncharacterized protein n=1 Tax=Phyllosticta capitalensis TaxID=121624 RepID=UPI00312DB182